MGNHTYNSEAGDIFYHSDKPTIQIKGDYIYAFDERFTRAMHISDIEEHILEFGDAIE